MLITCLPCFSDDDDDDGALFIAPRKSLPLKFSPLARSSGKSRIFDSPDSEAGDYSPDGADPSPSPSLRTHAHAALLSAPRKSLGNLSHSIGLGRPSTGGRLSTSASANNIGQLSGGGGGGGLFGKSSSASSGLDMLTSMGITSKRADALRRTSSGAWSFSSESSSDGGSHLGTPTRVTGMCEYNITFYAGSQLDNLAVLY